MTWDWMRNVRSCGPLLVAGLLAGTAASADPQGPWHWPWPGPQRPNQDVYQALTVKYAKHRICRTLVQGVCKEWDEVKLRSYNGRLVGPTIEVRPGSTLRIMLENQLPPDAQPDPNDPNVPHGFNTTNLHTHGLHVSPAGNSDNVLMSVRPGRTFEYEIKIPKDHPAGTYWYHPHKHGAVAIQVANGLAGALIVRGDIDEVPAIRAARERVLVFQQIPYALTNDPYEPGKQALMVEDFSMFAPGRWEQSGRRTTINGEVEPTFKLRPGEVQRWRLIHAGVRETLRLKLVRESDPGSVVAHYQLAHDGITTGRLDRVDETEMYPGYRTDVLVKAGNRAETWLLLDEESPDGTGLLGETESRKVLARVVVEGRSVEGRGGSMPLPDEATLARLAPFEPIEDHELTGTQQARFEVDVRFNPPKFLINGKEYDPHAPPRRLELGAVEEWFVSSSRFSGHPFHIHVNPFQVMTNDGKVLWKDTLFVRPETSVRVRTRYRRYIGQFVLHCHTLDHEDLGMMEKLEIVPPGQGHGHGHP